jgi:xanthine dehydrogenase accessory factor
MSAPRTRAQTLAHPSTGAHPPAGAWLAPLAGHWIDAACTHLAHLPAIVRVTVVAVRGSTPREAGATMLVDVGTMGTIGGGELEWRATTLARALLEEPHATPVRIVPLILGPELGQCCGGRVELWLERLTRRDLPWLGDAARRLRTERGLALASAVTDDIVTRRLVSRPMAGAIAIERCAPGRVTLLESAPPMRPALWVFGAGHVGQSLVRLLAELALFEITWIDTRAELLPDCLTAGVTAEVCASPAARAAAAPAGTRFVVMTHDHALDYELCRVILGRAEPGWLGLIGSASKSARFRSRLLRDGLDGEAVARLHCPIGVTGISSKLPGAIAIAIAAQLLQQLPPPARQGVTTAERAEADVAGCAGDCGACAAHPSIS